VLRIVLTAFAVALLALPWLKLAGAVLLLWIGVKLLVPSGGADEARASDTLVAAIRTILVADVVMSLDNVIAVAAAADGDWVLLMIGLAISIPLVVFGATLLVKVMERFPIVITIGAALIGFVAGEMAWEDRAIISITRMHPEGLKYALATLCAAFVVVMGQWLAQRATSRTAASQHPAR
jgi:YjbE family integral membrane protein